MAMQKVLVFQAMVLLCLCTDVLALAKATNETSETGDMPPSVPEKSCHIVDEATDKFISTLGLILCIIPATVHGMELIAPKLVMLLVHYVLFPFFSLRIPTTQERLDDEDYNKMLQRAIDTAGEKTEAAADLIFMMTLEQRQSAYGMISMAAACIYGLTLDHWVGRRPLHFAFGVTAVLQLYVHLNHAGVPIGINNFVTRHGKLLSITFIFGMWIPIAICEWYSFVAIGKLEDCAL